jgi:hypothetical protein
MLTVILGNHHQNHRDCRRQGFHQTGKPRFYRCFHREPFVSLSCGISKFRILKLKILVDFMMTVFQVVVRTRYCLLLDEIEKYELILRRDLSLRLSSMAREPFPVQLNFSIPMHALPINISVSLFSKFSNLCLRYAKCFQILSCSQLVCPPGVYKYSCLD